MEVGWRRGDAECPVGRSHAERGNEIVLFSKIFTRRTNNLLALSATLFTQGTFDMPEPKRHAENRGAIESLLRRIPGFRGYLEKEYRRESDALQREWLADRLQRSKRGLDQYAQALADAAKIDTLPLVDRLRSRLDRLMGRVRGAMQGYSGFFDLVQIDEAALDRVYEYDVSLMEEVAALADHIDALGGRAEEADQLVPPLLDEIARIEEAWDQREDVLKGLE